MEMKNSTVMVGRKNTMNARLSIMPFRRSENRSHSMSVRT